MGFMCDQCKLNYRNACHDPRHPNVKWDEKCKNYCWLHAQHPYSSSTKVPPDFKQTDWSRTAESKRRSAKGEAEVDYDELAREMGGELE